MALPTYDQRTTWPIWTRFALTQGDLNAAAASLGAERRFERWKSSLRHRLLTGTAFPPLDLPKRWDEANVVELLTAAGQDLALLDAGAYNSPASWAASRLNLTSVDGIDLNPRLTMSPRANHIRYSCQNMMATAFSDEAFDVVVSGSTVEHGVDWDQWLAECRRILKPGGLLYVSTDVVAESTNTSDLTAFGLPWTPLRPSDIEAMPARFERAGFVASAARRPELPDNLPVQFLGHRIGFVGFAVVAG
ncbi:MAG: methyltransferase domain-containing protein [Actinobacteria bacterium]|nr:methyltransferase domain-containing protein [Actinomycetota bacterium]